MTKQFEFYPQQFLTYVDALQILRIVKSTEKCESVRVRIGEMQISLDRVSSDQGVRTGAPSLIAEPAAQVTTKPASASATDAGSGPGGTAAGDADITAPMVGFFHRCRGPGGTLNVQVGDMVQATDTIGIVKAMGISKPIVAGVSGRVTEAPVADAGFVEYGQPVLRVRQVAQ
jgi:acetyl-CoA carboxylase biotin carboxyl carrier protein